MRMVSIPQAGPSTFWSPVKLAGPAYAPPAPPQLAARQRPVYAQRLAQETPPAQTPAAGSGKPPLIDSALASLFMDAAGAVSTGMIAYTLASAKPAHHTWSKVLYAIAAGFGVKGVLDLAQVRER